MPTPDRRPVIFNSNEPPHPERIWSLRNVDTAGAVPHPHAVPQYAATRRLHCPECGNRYRIDATSEGAFAHGTTFGCVCGKVLSTEEPPQGSRKETDVPPDRPHVLIFWHPPDRGGPRIPQVRRCMVCNSDIAPADHDGECPGPEWDPHPGFPLSTERTLVYGPGGLIEQATHRKETDMSETTIPSPKQPAGVTLRLHPDGHWMPNTPGRWLWRSPNFVEGPVEFEVFERDGGLMFKFAQGPAALLPYDSIRMAPKGTWEWVTPAEETPDAPR